jgi:hypothetical protein
MNTKSDEVPAHALSRLRDEMLQRKLRKLQRRLAGAAAANANDNTNYSAKRKRRLGSSRSSHKDFA